MNMPAVQNRSNFAFRYGFIRLATVPNAKSGLRTLVKVLWAYGQDNVCAVL